MTHLLLFIGIVMTACILMQKLTSKLPVPSLLAFLLLGMMFGVDGLFRISFSNYQITKMIFLIHVFNINYFHSMTNT